jgi:putative ABC transport system permease protein
MKVPTPRPPALATRLLTGLLSREISEPFLGDLAESFDEVRRHQGLAAARHHYWRETVRAPFRLRPTHAEGSQAAPHRGDGLMTILLADLRYAFRHLGRRTGFATLVIGTLALGIGATTAIFSAVYPILFAPLPYPHAERIVMVSERGKDGNSAGIGYATILDIRDMSHSFEGIAAITGWGPTLTERAEPEVLNGENVSFSFFRVLGVAPALGRDFRADEDVRGVPRVAILSNALWRSRFGGDTALIGKTITLNETAFTVVGVMAAGFENLVGPQTQIWTTLRYNLSLPFACRTCHHVRAIARLKPNVAPRQALSELNTISARLVADHPSEYAAPGMLAPTLAEQVTTGVRPALLAVFGAVVLLLLIACANATNLLLARATQRQGEFSVRAALGAGHGRIIRQLLTESLLLALIAGTVGVGIAIAGVRALVAIAPPGLPRIDAIQVNSTALVFTLATATAIGVIFGLVPALHAVRGELYNDLKQSTRRGAGTRRLTRGTLVVSEVALALMLLVGSGLMLRTMIRLLGVSPGFEASHLLTMQVQTTGKRFDNDTVTHLFFAEVLAAVRALPGVEAAAFTSQLPLSGDYDGYGMHMESKPNPNPENDPSPFRYAVSPGYLETMKIPLRRGRSLRESDGENQPPVVVINETFAHKMWPTEDPIGQRVRLGAADKGPWFTIVGIVGDVRHVSLAAELPSAVYLPEVQWPFADGMLTLVIRANGDADALTSATRKAIWSVDRNQPIVRIATMNALVAGTEAQRKFTLLLFTAFAVVALILAAAGIYGVLSGTVTERLAEIGVRSALGASRNNILWLVVRQGITLTGIGLIIGLVGASLLSRLIGSLLFGIARGDLVTYLGVTTMLAAVATAASWIPAWRAARVDPAVVLRAD